MDRKLGKEKPILIAMKGHPGTGKNTLANTIARTLKCPLVDKDHFRDSTYPIQQALIQASPATATKLLNDLSYDAMWRIASAHLGLGLSVVVDSPLSRRGHLDRLVDITAVGGARIVVVECRPGDEEWRGRVEFRGGEEWHKPSTWKEMERLLDAYGGCWDYEVGQVTKLVLHTTGSVGVEQLVNKVVEFIK